MIGDQSQDNDPGPVTSYASPCTLAFGPPLYNPESIVSIFVADGVENKWLRRYFPNSCSALGRKIVAMYNSFTSKSLKEHIFPPLMEMLIFLNLCKAPLLTDLKKPEEKVPHTMNFYVQPEPGVVLGVWHTVPCCRAEDAKGKDRCWYEAALQDGNPIMVYLHGNTGHRGTAHRCKRIKVLSDGGFHVLSVDYRGFGDSTGRPTERGLAVDAICIYQWAKARSGGTPVCLWGHSLGTGVATDAAKILEERGNKCLHATISRAETIKTICRKFPRCFRTLIDSLKEDRIVFANDENVKFLSSPLLIIHGVDDRIVPVEDAKKLYETAYAAYRHKERVKMVIFPPGFQHNYLCKSPMFVPVLRDFLSKQWA
ncbi:protein ABHD12B [Octodon degus]|uniref:Protein ABHD12B n=1 Tax=Octodon degus TaxID=10160 RepID=A0A6P3F4S9_OCTDE|nr:protein ABHD12B [Octodon degus]